MDATETRHTGHGADRAPAANQSATLLTPRAAFLMASGWMASGWIAAAGVAGMWITAEWKSAVQNHSNELAAQIDRPAQNTTPYPTYSDPVSTAGHSQLAAPIPQTEEFRERTPVVRQNAVPSAPQHQFDDTFPSSAPSRLGFEESPVEDDGFGSSELVILPPGEIDVKPRTSVEGSPAMPSNDDLDLAMPTITRQPAAKSNPLSAEALRAAVKSSMREADELMIDAWVEQLSGLDEVAVREILEARTRIGNTAPTAGASTPATGVPTPVAPQHADTPPVPATPTNSIDPATPVVPAPAESSNPAVPESPEPSPLPPN